MSENEAALPDESGLTLVQDDEEKKLLSDEYEDTKEIISILYIHENISGRINFAKNHPELAQLILGEDLIKLDQEGAEDLKARAQLEDRAAKRQQKLVDLVNNLEARSVEKGLVKTEFVENVIQKLGRTVALMLYAPRLVDKVFPPSPEEVAEAEAQQAAAQPQPEQVETPPEPTEEAVEEQAEGDEAAPQAEEAVGEPSEQVEEAQAGPEPEEQPTEQEAPAEEEVPQEPVPEPEQPAEQEPQVEDTAPAEEQTPVAEEPSAAETPPAAPPVPTPPPAEETKTEEESGDGGGVQIGAPQIGAPQIGKPQINTSNED